MRVLVTFGRDHRLTAAAREELVTVLRRILAAQVPERLASVLLALDAMAVPDKDGRRWLRVTQDELAASCGGSRCYVSGLIMDWKREGRIQAVGRAYRLTGHGRDWLARLAGEV